MLMFKFLKNKAGCRLPKAGMLLAIFGVFWFVAIFVSHTATAEEYPNKPITMIIPYAAGGGGDTVGRVLAKALKYELGQPIVVVNRKGGGGAVGASFLKTAPADGYTFLFGAVGQIVAFIPLTTAVEFEYKDFRYLGSVTDFQNAFVASAGRPYGNLKEFVAYAKANPGVTIASQGGPEKLFFEQLAKKEGLEFKMISTGGGAEVMQLILGGKIETGFSGGFHANYTGKIDVVASMNPTRLAASPDKPTFIEYGINLAMPSEIGFMVPAALPDDIAQKLESAFMKAAQSEDFKKIVATRLKSKVRTVSSKTITKSLADLIEVITPLLKK